MLEPRTPRVGSVSLPTELSVESWQRCVVGMLTALECAQGHLLVECAELRSFDEGGLAMLIVLSRYIERRQVRVVLANPPEILRQGLELRGLGWLFEWRPLLP